MELQRPDQNSIGCSEEWGRFKVVQFRPLFSKLKKFRFFRSNLRLVQKIQTICYYFGIPSMKKRGELENSLSFPKKKYHTNYTVQLNKKKCQNNSPKCITQPHQT